jgi:hypothetical protein
MPPLPNHDDTPLSCSFKRTGKPFDFPTVFSRSRAFRLVGLAWDVSRASRTFVQTIQRTFRSSGGRLTRFRMSQSGISSSLLPFNRFPDLLANPFTGRATVSLRGFPDLGEKILKPHCKASIFAIFCHIRTIFTVCQEIPSYVVIHGISCHCSCQATISLWGKIV